MSPYAVFRSTISPRLTIAFASAIANTCAWISSSSSGRVRRVRIGLPQIGQPKVDQHLIAEPGGGEDVPDPFEPSRQPARSLLRTRARPPIPPIRLARRCRLAAPTARVRCCDGTVESGRHGRRPSSAGARPMDECRTVSTWYSRPFASRTFSTSIENTRPVNTMAISRLHPRRANRRARAADRREAGSRIPSGGLRMGAGIPAGPHGGMDAPDA